VIGEVQTERLAIEEGALLRGKIEAGKQPARAAESKSATGSTSGKPAQQFSMNSGTAAD
jgi:cytoskeletal protein CcmA (bactofilin family)